MSRQSAFTAEEVQQELDRRRQAQRDIEEARRPKPAGDIECIHCHSLFFAYQSAGAEYGLCDYCLHKD
jgi:hypothetical protein